MNTPTTPSIPAISSTDAEGVVWTFEPDQKRWSARVGQKKMSSASLDTLKEKVAGHKTDQAIKKAGKVPPSEQRQQEAKPLDAILIKVEFERSLLTSNNLPTKSLPKFVPTQVKLEWNAEGGVRVARYKGPKDDGWQSRDASDQIFIHPSFTQPHMLATLEKFALGQALKNLSKEAENQIAAAWWSVKEETVNYWGFGAKDVPYCDTRPNYVTNGALACSAIPMLAPLEGSEAGANEWVSQDDGSLKQGDVSVRLNTQPDKFGRPSFDFEVLMGDRTDPVFIDRQLYVALQVGNATHQMLTNKPAMQTLWLGADKWDQPKGEISWPNAYRVNAGVLVGKFETHRVHASPQTLFFGDIDEEALRSVGFEVPEDKGDLKGNAWRPLPKPYQGGSVRLGGVEDSALIEVSSLRKSLNNVRDKLDLGDIPVVDLKKVFEGTLSDVYNALVDGEEFPNDAASVVEGFDRHKKRFIQRAVDNEEVIKFKEKAGQAVEKAKDWINRIEEKEPAARSPKPR